MKVLNAFSKSLFLFSFSSIILETESLTPIKYKINISSRSSWNNNNRIQSATTTIHQATSSSSSASSIMEQEQQQEAKRICPFLPSPEDPTTIFEAAMG
mmetsp:Transcript_1752/g.2022  ORF Transcript_1752/g.2022 Transcript_1752/m.2022 type:complete len:99 (+) Transcript_1752:81-377(+)